MWLSVRNGADIYKELASGSMKAIPWKKFLPQARECVLVEHLPAAYLEHLAEPSSMRDNECHSLLAFWYQRQVADHSPVFRVQQYLVQDQLVEGNPRELVEADNVEAEDPCSPSKAHGKRRQPKAKSGGNGRRVLSAKGKEKADSFDESSDGSSTQDKFIPVRSDVTLTNDADDEGDALGLDLLYDDSRPSSSTLRPDSQIHNVYKSPEAALPPLTLSQVGPPIVGSSVKVRATVGLSTASGGNARPSCAPLTTNHPPTSTPTAILPITPEQPSPKELDDEDFTKEPLDLSSLQPELQEIVNSLTTNTSPTVRRLLLTAFQALQVETRLPPSSGPFVQQAVLILPQDHRHEMKRSRWLDSWDLIPSSLTKKSRFLQSDSISSEEGKGISNEVSIKGHRPDLSWTADEHNQAEGSTTDTKRNVKVKKVAKVVLSAQVPRRTHSQGLSHKIVTRASANHPK